MTMPSHHRQGLAALIQVMGDDRGRFSADAEHSSDGDVLLLEAAANFDAVSDLARGFPVTNPDHEVYSSSASSTVRTAETT